MKIIPKPSRSIRPSSRNRPSNTPGRRGIVVAARELGLVEQTLRNWVKAAEAGKLLGAGAKPVTPKQMEPSRLRAQSARLKMHVDIPKKRWRTLPRIRCEVRAGINAQRRDYPLTDMCEVLAVSVCGYRAWKRGGKPDRTRLTDEQVVALMKSIHAEVKGAYGTWRIHREFQGCSYCIDLRRVERLMRDNGIRARHKRRFKATTGSRHSMPVAPKLLARHFTSQAPNKVWTGRHHVHPDWRGLAVPGRRAGPVQPLGGRLVDQVAHDGRIVTEALKMAWFRRKPRAGVLFHSDRGSQYASHVMTARLGK